MKYKILFMLTAVASTVIVSGSTNAAVDTGAVSNVNVGLTFHNEKSGGARKSSRNIDGVSFDIAERKNPREIDWMKRAQRGSRGNVTCYVDKDGAPTAVYVIGVAPISKTMIAVEAEDEAQFEAEANAKEAFALWMKEYVTIDNVREMKRLVVRLNGEETSETTTESKRKFIQTANAQWRGMSLYADAQKDGRYVAIWRWSVKEQELARMVEQLTRDESLDSVKGKKDRKVDWKVKERAFSFREDD